MKILGVIPARYESSRMPGKPIVDILGKPMIWWVYQQALKCKELTKVVIATDDERILNVCTEYGMDCIMTSLDHNTPTSRLYEVSTRMDADLYLMIMGDEPLVNAECFSLVIPKEYDEMYVGALTNILTDPAEVIDFSNQKVVTNANRKTLLISRSPIPYPKGSLDIEYEKVTGVQIFTKQALSFFNKTAKSKLEMAEENDLMRFVENDIPVYMTISKFKTISVDTPKDLVIVRQILEEGKTDARRQNS